MSWQAVQAALRHSRSRGTTRLVLVAIAERADKRGRDARPSIVEIAADANVHKETVVKAVRSLVDAGEIETTPGRGRGHRSSYTLRIMNGPVQLAQAPEPADDAPEAPENGRPDPTLSEPENGRVDPTLSDDEIRPFTGADPTFYEREKVGPEPTANTTTVLTTTPLLASLATPPAHERVRERAGEGEAGQGEEVAADEVGGDGAALPLPLPAHLAGAPPEDVEHYRRLLDVAPPLSEREELLRPRMVEIWEEHVRRAAPAMKAVVAYSHTFGLRPDGAGGVKPGSPRGGASRIVADLARRWPPRWLVAAFVVASEKGTCGVGGVAGFLDVWERHLPTPGTSPAPDSTFASPFDVQPPTSGGRPAGGARHGLRRLSYGGRSNVPADPAADYDFRRNAAAAARAARRASVDGDAG